MLRLEADLTRTFQMLNSTICWFSQWFSYVHAIIHSSIFHEDINQACPFLSELNINGSDTASMEFSGPPAVSASNGLTDHAHQP